jgi:hypothetical protein
MSIFGSFPLPLRDPKENAESAENTEYGQEENAFSSPRPLRLISDSGFVRFPDNSAIESPNVI